MATDKSKKVKGERGEAAEMGGRKSLHGGWKKQCSKDIYLSLSSSSCDVIVPVPDVVLDPSALGFEKSPHDPGSSLSPRGPSLENFSELRTFDPEVRVPASINNEPKNGVSSSGNSKWVDLFRQNRTRAPGCDLSYIPPAVSNGVRVVKFRSTEVLEETQRPLILKAWIPRMKLDLCDIQELPIWIQLPLLPLEFWTKDILSRIGSILGKPLFCDLCTLRRNKLGWARILVDMRIAGAFPDSIILEDEFGAQFTQNIMYEWKSIPCSICKQFGHDKHLCPSALSKSKQVWKEKVKHLVIATATNLVATNVVASVISNSACEIAAMSISFAKMAAVKGKAALPTVASSNNCESGSTLTFKNDVIVSAPLTGSTPIIIPPSTGVIGEERSVLWPDLVDLALSTSGAWLVQGDFNVILNNSERIGGAHITNCGSEFGACLFRCGLSELSNHGSFFTWTNNQDAKSCIWRKLDRCLINSDWLDVFPGYDYEVISLGLFDHSPLIVHIKNLIPQRASPFKFFNMWTTHPHFKQIVSTVWRSPISGSHMFVLWSKLKLLAKELRVLNRVEFSDVFVRIANCKASLDHLQSNLHQAPLDQDLLDQERALAIHYRSLKFYEESYFRQKARADWLKLGDQNTKYFHQSLKLRYAKNNIVSLRLQDGSMCFDHPTISRAMIDFYEDLLGVESHARVYSDSSIWQAVKLLSSKQATYLCRPVSYDEVKSTLMGMGSNKAPGVDGFNAYFFKKEWDTVGPSVFAAIDEFFRIGCLLKQFNSTALVVIPKTPNPSGLTDYRSIACCTIIYKLITKILAIRTSQVMPSIIVLNQSAFVKGRRIADNILLAHELVHNYHRNNGNTRLTLKVDLRKAFDSVSWDFLEEALLNLDFPSQFIDWVMTCVRTSTFSIVINGGLEGYFHGKKGVRQGDPISPLLFVIAIEYLSRCFHHLIPPDFGFHPGCRTLRITHLCFADDLLVFYRGSFNSITQVMSILKYFEQVSGLHINEGKSLVFFSGVTDHIKAEILTMLNFKEGSLPVTYLGISLISSGLKKEHCDKIIHKITARITCWISRFLSYGGRIQLVISVLQSLYVYMCSIFMLPKSIIQSIDRLCWDFLWHGNSNSKSRPVAWHDVCLPKKEGGLGLKSLSIWNCAAVGKNIWFLLTSYKSLWAAWIRTNKLRTLSYWGIIKPPNVSWCWRKLLDLRSMFKGLFSYCLGSSIHFKFWTDPWLRGVSLIEKFPSICIVDANISKSAYVADVWHDNHWQLPDPINSITAQAWDFITAHFTCSIDSDIISWKLTTSGIYSIASAYEYFRPKKPVVTWYNLIWGSSHVPKCSFIAWLAINGRLATRSRLLRWGVTSSDLCSLCGEEEKRNSAYLEYIPSLISPEENLAFLTPPTLEELKQVVWEMCEVILPPLSILHQLEMIFEKFFWGSSDSKGKAHWISWARICKAKLEGGLGVRRLCVVATAISLKLWHRFREHNTPRARFLTKMYCGATSPLIVAIKCKASPCWRRMLKAPVIAEKHIRWTVGGGWVKFCERKSECFNYRFIVDQCWDLNKLRAVLPCLVDDEVAEVVIQKGDPVNMIRKLSSDGKFSMKSAWNGVRDHGGQVIMAKHGTISIGSNVRAELVAIRKGLELCSSETAFSFTIFFLKVDLVWVSAGTGISQLEAIFGFSYDDLLVFWCLDFLELCF
ncbi:hypothetical protein ZIOFF_031349 [Zingiber officinale]|uniref:Reverse transcriptase domain-containing protein n=1 Tax=Zingiber officinale TaxID=94328 RepID=A0A8J5GSX9_ZINOF|nr:hypothetical protein ZIOFF_031349 [Zingiber officinale]